MHFGLVQKVKSEKMENIGSQTNISFQTKQVESFTNITIKGILGLLMDTIEEGKVAKLLKYKQ